MLKPRNHIIKINAKIFMLFIYLYIKKIKIYFLKYYLFNFKILFIYLNFIGDWGLGMGIGDWAQSPIPNPQSPIPNPHVCLIFLKFK